jgi:hypothetical protein
VEVGDHIVGPVVIPSPAAVRVSVGGAGDLSAAEVVAAAVCVGAVLLLSTLSEAFTVYGIVGSLLAAFVASIRIRARLRKADRLRADTVSAAPELTVVPPPSLSPADSGGSTKATSDGTVSEPFSSAADRAALWTKALRQHNELREAFASYETNPTEFFYRPLLADRSHPAVQAFYEAFDAADALRVDDGDFIPSGAAYIHEFADRVSRAERTWTIAYELAGRTGELAFTDEQRSSMRVARRLLDLALDENATVAERNTAYDRMIQQFSKAGISPPASIEHGVQRQLEVANPGQLERPMVTPDVADARGNFGSGDIRA